MRIRIVSDLHIDVNKTKSFGFIDKLDKTDLTLIAGDIAGGWRTEYDFLQNLNGENPIVCIAGNHLGYDYFKTNFLFGVDDTKEFSLNCLVGNIGSVTYLHNNYIEYNDYIIFGGTMYTDFNLYGETQKYEQWGEKGLNDFVNVKTFDSDLGVIRTVTGDDYIKWYKLFLKKLKECLKNYPNKKFIVLTHFCPSPKSIAKQYKSGINSYLNPCYCVDLEDFILKNKNIKLWVHGHTHTAFDYKIGDCRIVCSPYGYYEYEHNIAPKDYSGKVIRL